jgi:hypothetical protein
MLNQFIKWTVLIGIWKKFKRHIIATLLMIVMLYVVSLIHADYLLFVQSAKLDNASANVATSFFIKWGISLFIVIGYAYLLRYFQRSGQVKLKPQSKSVPNEQGSSVKSDKPDPFDQIRKKKKLRSKADLTISKVRVKRN